EIQHNLWYTLTDNLKFNLFTLHRGKRKSNLLWLFFITRCNGETPPTPQEPKCGTPPSVLQEC
ncbi:MAG: hypothetical protein VB102_11420, partial [Paludibacter sp.]|nr:hypothetical protein [Paludibacter sp.]